VALCNDFRLRATLGNDLGLPVSLGDDFGLLVALSNDHGLPVEHGRVRLGHIVAAKDMHYIISDHWLKTLNIFVLVRVTFDKYQKINFSEVDKSSNNSEFNNEYGAAIEMPKL
jgi:hypothetical protein